MRKKTKKFVIETVAVMMALLRIMARRRRYKSEMIMQGQRVEVDNMWVVKYY